MNRLKGSEPVPLLETASGAPRPEKRPVDPRAAGTFSQLVDGRLDANFRWCKALCRSSRSSFYRSFGRLDPERRNAMYALYAFARIIDDIGDGDAPREHRYAMLSEWRAQLHERLGDSASTEFRAPVLTAQYSALWPALAYTVERFEIDPQWLNCLIDGVALDIDHHPPADWDDLEKYCYHVASTVGLACTQIWRRDEADIQRDAIHARAVECGYAFQLTNILRDVSVDAAMGRCYIPLATLKRFDIDHQSWLDGKPTGQWTQMIDYMADKALGYYDSGSTLQEQLTPRSRLVFSLMLKGYRKLLQQVVQNKQRLWGPDRIGLSLPQKTSLLFSRYVLRS